jgi:hypothetical protein
MIQIVKEVFERIEKGTDDAELGAFVAQLCRDSTPRSANCTLHSEPATTADAQTLTPDTASTSSTSASAESLQDARANKVLSIEDGDLQPASTEADSATLSLVFPPELHDDETRLHGFRLETDRWRWLQRPLRVAIADVFRLWAETLQFPVKFIDMHLLDPTERIDDVLAQSDIGKRLNAGESGTFV